MKRFIDLLASFGLALGGGFIVLFLIGEILEGKHSPSFHVRHGFALIYIVAIAVMFLDKIKKGIPEVLSEDHKHSVVLYLGSWGGLLAMLLILEFRESFPSHQAFAAWSCGTAAFSLVLFWLAREAWKSAVGDKKLAQVKT